MGPSSKRFWTLVNTVQTVPLALPATASRAPTRAFRFSNPQRTAVIAAYEAGTSMASLAHQYGVRRDAISGVLRRAGVTVRSQRVMDADDIDQAIALYNQGQSLKRIGKQLNWNAETIRHKLKQRGVSIRGPHDRPAHDDL